MHNLVKEILEENRWRDGELAIFKSNPIGLNNVLWSRVCIPMIYAHWEGYVVNSIKLLIGYLNKLELMPNETPTKLIVLGLNERYAYLSGKQSFEQKAEFTDKFKEIFQSAIRFKKDIDTKSNLNSKVLKEICSIFDLNFSSFKDVTFYIDKVVVLRNRIAHGENSMIPDADSVAKYIASITEATDILLSEIEEYVTNEKFRLKSDKDREAGPYHILVSSV